VSREARLRWCAPAIVVAAVLAAAAAGWNNSATNDEPYHTLAGFLYVREGHADLNPEHPPLAKLLAGVALQPLGLRATAAGPVRRLGVLSQEVRAFLYFNTVPSETILRLARLPGLAFLAALLAGVYLWASFAWGERAGVLALLAAACQPLLLGHAPIVHTDVPAAATWVWTGYLVHRWIAGSRRAWVGVGVALGLALLVKFSAVLLALTVALAVALLAVRSRRLHELARLAGVAGVALAVLVCGVWLAVRNVSVDEELATIDAYLRQWPGSEPRADALKTLATFSVPLAHWGLGLAYVAETNEHGQGINFLAGRTSTHGFAAYFPVALVAKTSAPFLLLALLGVVGAVRARDGVDLALLAVTAGYVLVSLPASYNIGARHLLPVVPLLAMVGGHHAVSWPRAARLALTIALLAAPVVAFPHYIAHFSALVGGARGGVRLLNDSNLDWGQDWRRLGLESAARGWSPMTYLYLGAGDPARDVPHAEDALDLPALPATGFVGLSRYVKTLGVPYLRALRAGEDAERLERALSELDRRGRLVSVIGDSIEVYRLEIPSSDGPGGGASHGSSNGLSRLEVSSS
jgi:hypothetical protein